jgi:hypothetical protein
MCNPVCSARNIAVVSLLILFSVNRCTFWFIVIAVLCKLRRTFINPSCWSCLLTCTQLYDKLIDSAAQPNDRLNLFRRFTERNKINCFLFAINNYILTPSGCHFGPPRDIMVTAMAPCPVPNIRALDRGAYIYERCTSRIKIRGDRRMTWIQVLCQAGLWSQYTKSPTPRFLKPPTPRFLKLPTPTPRFLKLRLRLLHKSSICINNGKPIRCFIATTWIIRLLFLLITSI